MRRGRQLLAIILSILVARCIGSGLIARRGAGSILEVLVQMGVLLALLLTTHGRSFGMRGAQVGQPRGF